MLIVTVYALCGEDARLMFWDLEADETFMYLNIASLVIFSVELVLACYSKKDYFNSFFFWLDIISTLSIVTDIEPIWAAMTSAGDSTEGSDSTDAAQLVRASRGARVGTRAGRMTRVIRLIRLIRIVKLYKSANQALQDDGKKKVSEITQQMEEVVGEKELNQVAADDQEAKEMELLMSDQKESVVGKKLSDFTTRKVIMLVLSMLFMTPIFSVE